MNFASSGLVNQPLITDMSRTGNFYFIANLCLSAELCMRMEYRMVFFFTIVFSKSTFSLFRDFLSLDRL